MEIDEVSLFENNAEFIDLTKCKKDFVQFSQNNF